MPTIYVTQGDVGDPIHVRGMNGDGTAISPFVGGTTAVFRARNHATGHTWGGSCTITGPNSDELVYTTVAGDSAALGRYVARFVVTYADGTVRSFPSACPPSEVLYVEVCQGA